MADYDETSEPTKKQSSREKKSIIKEAVERYDYVNTVDKENKEAAAEDTKFVYVAGAQWPDQIKKERKDADEPCLEFPQLKQFVNQVVNDQRQNRPGIRIHPAGAEASKEVAELLQGVIRGIEYASQAEAAYDTGFQHSVVGGRGYWRIGSKYESEKSFNQILCIQRIADPNTVDLDPDYIEPDGSDRNWGFVSERVKKDEFKDRWPKAKALSWDPGTSPRWYNSDEEVVVADYYRRVCEDADLVALSDGSTMYDDELPPQLPPGLTVVDRRQVDRYRIEWYKIAGGEQILEQYDWPGTILPIVCCMGDEVIVEGKRHFYGLIRQARDAQRMYNYKKTAEVQRYALAPKAPFIAPVEAITGYEGIWKTANKQPYSTLPYHAYTDDGRALPPPQRVAPAPMEGAWAQSAEMDKQDMKSVIGMYENSLGLHGSETSGRAIMAREKQGDNSTFHFVDNLSRAIALTGRIIVELIPHYYDTQRLVTVVKMDDTREQVTINQPVPGAADPITGAVNAVMQNDVTSGEYAVTVEAGPSFATRRQELSDSLMQLVQSFPPMMQFAGDLVVGAMDFPDADKLAERFKAMFPPPIQQMLQAESGGQDPQVAQLQQQLQQVQQQAQQALQGMQQQLQQTQQQLQSKQLDNQSRTEIEQIKQQTAHMQADYKRMEAVLDLLKTMLTVQAQQTMPIGPETTQLAPQAEAAVEGMQ